MQLLSNIESALSEHRLNLKDFREAAYRMTEKQVIYRRERTAESILYEKYLRLEDILHD